MDLAVEVEVEAAHASRKEFLPWFTVQRQVSSLAVVGETKLDSHYRPRLDIGVRAGNSKDGVTVTGPQGERR